MLITDFVQFLFVFPIPVMELKTIQSDIQEPAPDIVFPNISDPRIRKWTNQTNVISLSPAALDEVAQGANVDAHVCGVLFKTVGDLSIPIEEGQGYVLTYCSMLESYATKKTPCPGRGTFVYVRFTCCMPAVQQTNTILLKQDNPCV